MSDYLKTLFGLHDKIVLVTGGGTGIGKASAMACGAAGATVVIVGRRLEKLEQAASDIRGTSSACHLVEMDVADAASVRKGLQRIADEVGVVDVLINNAGTNSAKAMLDVTDEEWQRVFSVNLLGPWRLAAELARHWVETQRSGNVINVGSIIGDAPQKGVAAYGVSKAAIMHATRLMALEWARFGIRVNALVPGYFGTDMTDAMLETEYGRRLLVNNPMRRSGRLDELAGAVVYLASDAASYTHGTSLVVDGGHLSRSL